MNTNLDQYELNGVNIGTEIKNKILGINFGNNGAIGEPQTIVLTQNDLGDPSHIPINIDGLSPEAYNYLDTASSGYSDDTYNWYVKTYGAGAAGWYMNNPNSNPKNNPFLPGGAYVPFTDRASNPNQPVSDTNIPSPFAGAQDGDEFAFLPFGGNNKNTPPPPPTKRTNKGTFDAQRASSGMYPNMTPEKFFQKYGMSYNEYLNLP